MKRLKNEDIYLLRKEYGAAGFVEDYAYIDRLFGKR